MIASAHNYLLYCISNLVFYVRGYWYLVFYLKGILVILEISLQSYLSWSWEDLFEVCQHVGSLETGVPVL